MLSGATKQVWGWDARARAMAGGAGAGRGGEGGGAWQVRTHHGVHAYAAWLGHHQFTARQLLQTTCVIPFQNRVAKQNAGLQQICLRAGTVSRNTAPSDGLCRNYQVHKSSQKRQTLQASLAWTICHSNGMRQ